MDDQSLFKPVFKGYHVRFKDDLFRAIQAVAEAECRSFNEQVIHFCRRCLLANDTREGS